MIKVAIYYSWAVALIFLVAACSDLSPAKKADSQQAPNRPKWEYKALDGSKLVENIIAEKERDPLEIALNKLGEDGWELVSILNPSGQVKWFVFKRPQS